MQCARGDGGDRACRWFKRLLAELGFELWIGDPAQIKAKRVRERKTDRLDAALLLQLLLEDRFPRVWIPKVADPGVEQPISDKTVWNICRAAAIPAAITSFMSWWCSQPRRIW